MFKYSQVIKIIIIFFCFNLFNISFAKSHNIDQSQIEQIIEEYLIKNPESIKSTLEKLDETLKRKKFKTAKQIGLDINKLKTDMENPEITLTLEKNREVAKLFQLNGTPAFIIGNKIYPGAISKNQLKEAIKIYRNR